jgi:hypothetical protein
LEPISIIIDKKAYVIPPEGYMQETSTSKTDSTTKKTTVIYTCTIAVTNGGKADNIEIGI